MSDTPRSPSGREPKASAALGALARRLDARATWSDLVLPPEQLALVTQITQHVRWRHTVYEGWGFATKSGVRGISALFAGESGTGKTMAAEVLSNDLQLDLYRIGLSAVVSKYIGETEKNLGRLFEAAEDANAILFFDEADALFGKRGEVKDSHDRYANIEISYLLQRMESYAGLSILSTNLRSELDPAFLRRLTFIIEFPRPTESDRLSIWQGIFPPAVPLEPLDCARLARLNLTGGDIHRIALNAAFLAAQSGEPVTTATVLKAAQLESERSEKAASLAAAKGPRGSDPRRSE